MGAEQLADELVLHRQRVEQDAVHVEQECGRPIGNRQSIGQNHLPASYPGPVGEADGLTGEEGTFVICSFLLFSCLAKAGEVERANPVTLLAAR